jgi:hypothetical protein
MKMDDVLNAFDFVIDLVCMMPPLEGADMAGIPQGLLIAACLGSVFLLVASVISSSMSDVFSGNRITVAVAAACIGAIGFMSMGRSTMHGILLIAYPAMVIALRSGEGMILGLKYQPHARSWHLVAFLVAAIGLYVALRQVPRPSLRVIRGIWAIFGAVIASFVWTRKVSEPDKSLLNSVSSRVALFMVFISTTLYVQSSHLDQLLFQWVFPVGVALGFFAAIKGQQPEGHNPPPVGTQRHQDQRPQHR